MRVAILLPPPRDRPTGGYLVQYAYANELVRQGHAVTVVHAWAPAPFTGPARWRDYLRERARLRLRGRPVVPWYDFEDGVRVRLLPFLHGRLLPRADATLFTAWQTVHGFSGPLPSNPWQIVFDYEFWRSRPDLRAPMEAAFTRPGIRRIATSSAVRGMLAEAGADTEATIGCGLDLATWCRTRSGSRPPLVGFPLRDEPHKAMPDAFAAAAAVRRAVPEARFACFGAAERAVPAGIERRGALSEGELRAFYNECAVFVLPSHYEGWGLPAAEAMACGAALVTTANGGTEDFAADGENALVVAPGDPGALAGAITRLLRDDALRSRLADAGVRRAAGMSWERSAGALVHTLAGAG